MSTTATTSTEWPHDARRDRLIGDWHIYQRTGGHRTSTDDLITAWYATHRTQADRVPQAYLDLGCGIGSVMLMVAHRLRPPRVVGVEAQLQSMTMVRRAVAEIPELASKTELIAGDFRETAAELRESGHLFDLITGSPPYFPIGTGVLPADPQRRACRFEERGGVEAYLEVGRELLNEGGRLYLVHQTAALARVQRSADACELAMTGRVDFHMSVARQQPFLSVFEFSSQPGPLAHHQVYTIRGDDGEVTDEYFRLRAELGLVESV